MRAIITSQAQRVTICFVKYDYERLPEACKQRFDEEIYTQRFQLPEPTAISETMKATVDASEETDGETQS